MTMRELDVYWDKSFVGTLKQDNTGKLSFSYRKDYLKRHARAISVSLPLTEDNYLDDKTRPFFSGILPDESVRLRLARYLGVSEKNPFALLEAIGGECAGALSLYPKGQSPPSPTNNDIEFLDNDKLHEILALIKRRPLLAGENNLRLSLAGAQNKLAVGFQQNKVLLMKGAAPTTHILKPAIEGYESSVFNEYFCMKLAKQVGLNVPTVHIHTVNDSTCYMVERYDRVKVKDGKIQRLHQEDFCQALSIPPELKYEREGGPTISQCHDLLMNYCTRPALEWLSFLDYIIFNYLIGNADAHGKNFSLLYKGEQIVLAPAYDLLSTQVYPALSHKMAMKIGGRYKPEELLLHHWERIIPDTKTAKKALSKRLKHLGEMVLHESYLLKKTLHKEGIKHEVFGDIENIIKARYEKIYNL